MKMAYAPYSIIMWCSTLTKQQKIYKAVILENSLYSIIVRKRIIRHSEGETELSAIAIVGGKDGVLKDFCAPCGVCRQVMREFVDPKSFLVILARSEEDYHVFFLEELLPLSFGPENL
jgi:cytidine deaminase